MNKKVVAMISVIGLAGVLAGCSGQEASKPEPAPASAAKGSEKVKIKLHTWYNDADFNPKGVTTEFQKKFPNIEVEFVSLSEKSSSVDYTKKLDLAAASGEQLDIVMLNSAAVYSQRVGLGLLDPLDDLLKKDNINYDEEYKLDTKINGKYYALPGKFHQQYVILNKTHLEEAGLPVPKDWTWDEFMDYSKKLTKGEGTTKRYGSFFFNLYYYNRLALLSQPQNNDILKDDGSSNMSSPLLKKSLEIRKKMEFDDKSTTPYSDTLSQKLHYRNQFMNQNTSMIIMGSFMNMELGGTEQFPIKFKTAVAPLPKNAAGDPSITAGGGDFIGLAATSKHKQEAYQFIRWFTTEGMVAQGKNTSAWKKADLKKEIDTILAGTKDPSIVDKDSLMHTLTNNKVNKLPVLPNYKTEVDNSWEDEFQLFMLSKQDIDLTIKNGSAKVEKIIQANKK
jgi:multiple sugar transport system substrate-binding protein